MVAQFDLLEVIEVETNHVRVLALQTVCNMICVTNQNNFQPCVCLSIELLIIQPLFLKATAAEYDREAAEKYKVEIEARITCLEFQAARLTGKDNKKERSAKGTTSVKTNHHMFE